jgi:hypothetical protein
MAEGSRAETWLGYVREGRLQDLQENWSIKNPGVGRIGCFLGLFGRNDEPSENTCFAYQRQSTYFCLSWPLLDMS